MQNVRSWWQKVAARFGPVGRRHPSRRSFRLTSGPADIAHAAGEQLEDRLLLTIDIAFDYRYDTNGFFNSQRQDVLEEAARIYEQRIDDRLTAIDPSASSNNWTAIFGNPATGSEVRLSNLEVAADQIIVFVGSRPLSSLAIGGPGGSSASGVPAFVDDVLTRGQTGMKPNGTDDTDFGTWGGTITFSSNVNWHSDLNAPTPGQNDLFSVALHELGHVFGFGTSDSFSNLVNVGGQFTGAAASDAFGGAVPLHTDRAHFAENTTSTPPGTATVQETLMAPEITTGTRKQITTVDWAALSDMGWEVADVAAPLDYGDAPDSVAGTSTGNYQTRQADDGPSHVLRPGLKIGDSVDGDNGGQQNTSARADDSVGLADEDGVDASALIFVEGTAASIDVTVTNTTGSNATLYGWIDLNSDGVFSNGTESANVIVPSGTQGGTVALNFPSIPINSAGETFARFRLSTDANASLPTGAAADGEVEDHAVTILTAASAYDPLPLFTWSAIAGAVRYELEVDNLTTGATRYLLQSHLSTNSFRPHEALPAGRYRWRYRAHTGSDFQAFSDYAYLTILETESRPFITDPVANSIDSLPTFAWSPVVGATRYELWINGTNRPRIIHQAHLTNASFTPETGLTADRYTAWVRAFDDRGPLYSWSAPLAFELAESSSSVLTDPVASATDTTPTFGWLPTAVNDYTLRISNVSTGQNNIIIDRNLTGTSYTLPASLPPGNYAATIQATGLNISSAVTFQVQEVANQAEWVAPNGDPENPLPVFNWAAVSGASRYEVWVNDVSRGVARVVHNSSLTDTTFTAPNPLSPGQYRAWVRAFNDDGSIGTWSAGQNFYVTKAVNTPTVWSPDKITDNGSPRFTWSHVGQATHYQVSFSYGLTGGTNPLPLTQTRVQNNVLQLDTPFVPGDYVVSVTAFDGDRMLGTAEKRFQITTTDDDVSVYSPSGRIDATRPTFTWSTVSNATRYALWVNDITRDVDAIILDYNVASPVYTPAFALQPGEYQVWTRAYNGVEAVSDWSAGVKFSVTESADVPVITAPLPNITSSMPIITWTALTANSAVQTWQVEVQHEASGQPVFDLMTGVTTTSVQPTTPLPPGDYRVRVRGVDTANTSLAWSDFHAFTVEAATSATLVSPLATIPATSGEVLFAWSTVQTAARYELWVNNITTGELKYIHETSVTDISFRPTSAMPAGNYRAWIRGIAADGNPSAWSAGVEFTVAVEA